MEPKITGEEFIETLTLDNFYRLVEISDLQTIRNLCISSQEFNYYCQQERFQKLIQRKVNLLRQEAVHVLINLLNNVLRKGIAVEIRFSNTQYTFTIRQNKIVYVLKNKVTGSFSVKISYGNEFDEIVSSAVTSNSPIIIHPFIRLTSDFINNNIGVELIPYVQFDEYGHGYRIKIMPQEFIKDYV